MGKYMRRSKSKSKSKSNSNSDSNSPTKIVDISSFLGVRTRAKTLALKTQKMTSLAAVNSSSFGYLQLRNRRLLRLKSPNKPDFNRNFNFIGNPNLGDSSSVAGFSPNSGVQLGNDDVNGEMFDGNCCGENLVEFDPKERSTRESTPSNMIRDSDAIPTPGSTIRPASSAQTTRRLRSSTERDKPISYEMNEFFTDAEGKQQKEFIQKYNFDPVNGKPLPGRYEWEKVKT